MELKERLTVLQKALTEKDRQLVADLLAHPEGVTGLTLGSRDQPETFLAIEEHLDLIVLSIAYEWKLHHRVDRDMWSLFSAVVKHAHKIGSSINPNLAPLDWPGDFYKLVWRRKGYEALLRVIDAATSDEERAWTIAGLVGDKDFPYAPERPRWW